MCITMAFAKRAQRKREFLPIANSFIVRTIPSGSDSFRIVRMIRY